MGKEKEKEKEAEKGVEKGAGGVGAGTKVDKNQPKMDMFLKERVPGNTGIHIDDYDDDSSTDASIDNEDSNDQILHEAEAAFNQNAGEEVAVITPADALQQGPQRAQPLLSKTEQVVVDTNNFVLEVIKAINKMEYNEQRRVYEGFDADVLRELHTKGILEKKGGDHSSPSWSEFKRIREKIINIWKYDGNIYEGCSIPFFLSKMSNMGMFNSMKEIQIEKCEWVNKFNDAILFVEDFNYHINRKNPQAMKFSEIFIGLYVEDLMISRKTMLNLFQALECLKYESNVCCNTEHHNSLHCISRFPAGMPNFLPDPHSESRFISMLLSTFNKLNLYKDVLSEMNIDVYQMVPGLPFGKRIGAIGPLLEYLFAINPELMLAKQGCRGAHAFIMGQLRSTPFWKHYDVVKEMFIVNGEEGVRAMEWVPQGGGWVPRRRPSATHVDIAPQIILFRYPEIGSYMSASELKRVFRPLIGPMSFIKHHASKTLQKLGVWGKDAVKGAISLKGSFPDSFTPVVNLEEATADENNVYNTIPMNLYYWKSSEWHLVSLSEWKYDANTGEVLVAQCVINRSVISQRRSTVESSQTGNEEHVVEALESLYDQCEDGDDDDGAGTKRTREGAPVSGGGVETPVDSAVEDGDGLGLGLGAANNFVELKEKDWEFFDLRPDDVVLNQFCLENEINLPKENKVINVIVPEKVIGSDDEYSGMRESTIIIPPSLDSDTEWSTAWSEIVEWILTKIPEMLPFLKIVSAQSFSFQKTMVLFGQSAGRAPYGNWDKLPLAMAMTGTAGSGKSSISIPISEWAGRLAANVTASAEGQFNIEEWINPKVSAVIIANDVGKSQKGATFNAEFFKKLLDIGLMDAQTKNIQRHSKHQPTQAIIITSNLRITEIFTHTNIDEKNALLRRVLEFRFTKKFNKTDNNEENAAQSYQQNMAMYMVVSNIFYNLMMLFRCKNEHKLGGDRQRNFTGRKILEANPFNREQPARWVPDNLSTRTPNMFDRKVLLAILEPCAGNELKLSDLWINRDEAGAIDHKNPGYFVTARTIRPTLETRIRMHGFSKLWDTLCSDRFILSKKYTVELTDEENARDPEEGLELWPDSKQFKDEEVGRLHLNERNELFVKKIGDGRTGQKLKQKDYKIMGWRLKETADEVEEDHKFARNARF